MQMDAWLTDASYPDRCPLCSQTLAGTSNICPACGFTAHEPVGNPASPARPAMSRQPNPITPIPARASAQRGQSKPGVIPRRNRASPAASPSSGSPAVQQGGGWQHESSSYEAVSSLSSLSLIISETPTAPPRPQRSTERLEHIDEIDTVPQPSGQTRAVQPVSGHVQAMPLETPETPLPADTPSLSFADLDVSNLAVVLSETTPPALLSHVDEIDTVPEAGSSSSRVPALSRSATREVAVDAASWTAGPGATRSLAARFVAARSPRRRSSRTFTPLDRTRWWLLRPGHIEFLLWTAGSVLLFGVTFVLLLATVLSVMLPGFQAGGNFPTSTVGAAVTTPGGSTATSANFHLALVGKTSFAPGAELHLQGDGFRPQSTIIFLLDGRLALLDQHGKAASIQADQAGRFTVDLWLGQGSAWPAGPHQLLARETPGGQQVSIAITITAAPNTPSKPAPVQPTPTPIRPTPTPAQPTPTPGLTPSPSPDPTKSATATPVLSGGSATPGKGATAGSSSLGNSLNSADDNSLVGRLTHLNPLVWFIGICYFISVIFLGLAGLLRRRR